jgi:hypothetical protein
MNPQWPRTAGEFFPAVLYLPFYIYIYIDDADAVYRLLLITPRATPAA